MLKDKLESMGWTMTSTCTDAGGYNKPSRYTIRIRCGDGPEYETSYSQGSAYRVWSRRPTGDDLGSIMTVRQWGPVCFGSTAAMPKQGQPVTQGQSGRLGRYKPGPLHEDFARCTKPTDPTLDAVLWVLLMDAQYVDGLGFSDFCDELGYSTDSIQDRRTYLACQETNSWLNKSGADREALDTLFIDY